MSEVRKGKTASRATSSSSAPLDPAVVTVKVKELENQLQKLDQIKQLFYESLQANPLTPDPDEPPRPLNEEEEKDPQKKLASTLLSPRELACFDDACFLRHLRARQWNLPKTLEMLRENLRWRREVRPYRIRCTEVEQHFRSGKNYHNGGTKEGRPVIYMRVRLDTPGDNVGKIKTILYQMERSFELMEERRQKVAAEQGVPPEDEVALAHRVLEQAKRFLESSSSSEQLLISSFSLDNTPVEDQVAWFFDCKKFAKKDINMSLSKELAKTLDHYPERLGVTFLLDTPVIFRAFWKLAKKLIDERTHQKVNFVSNEEDRKKIFPRFFDMEELESCYGGKNEFVYDHDKMVEAENERRRREEELFGIPFKPLKMGDGGVVEGSSNNSSSSGKGLFADGNGEDDEQVDMNGADEDDKKEERKGQENGHKASSESSEEEISGKGKQKAKTKGKVK
ncbi:phosphatidylinositol transfer protein csr1 [Balamuthia mandrillaris]